MSGNPIEMQLELHDTIVGSYAKLQVCFCLTVRFRKDLIRASIVESERNRRSLCQWQWVADMVQLDPEGMEREVCTWWSCRMRVCVLLPPLMQVQQSATKNSRESDQQDGRKRKEEVQ